MLESILGFFRSIWQLFALVHPLLGVSFGTILLGFFVASLSLRILVPLLGIGASVGRGFVSWGRRARFGAADRSRSRQREAFRAREKGKE